MLSGERGLSDVAEPRRAAWLDRRKLILIGILGIALVGVLFLWQTPQQRTKEDVEAAKPNTHLTTLEGYMGPKAEAMPQTPPAPQPPPQTQPQTSPPNMGGGSMNIAKPVRPAMYSVNVAEIPEALRQKSAAAPAAGGVAGAPGGTDDTHIAFKGSVIAGARAGLLKDTSLILPPGLTLCSLLSDINTDQAGPFQCQLYGDVKSDDGVPLMDAGTMITGSYDSRVSQGQKRIAAISATAWVRPRNSSKRCIVPIGGPASDVGGAAGIPGEVDNHILERFGGAIALSLTDSALQILQAAVSNNGHGGNTYLSFNSGGVSSLASDILRSTINIPPTITAFHSRIIGIWLTQAIDFSDCYKLVSVN